MPLQPTHDTRNSWRVHAEPMREVCLRQFDSLLRGFSCAAMVSWLDLHVDRLPVILQRIVCFPPRIDFLPFRTAHMNAESRFIDGFIDRLVPGTCCKSYAVPGQVVTASVNRQAVKHEDIAALEGVEGPFRRVLDQVP